MKPLSHFTCREYMRPLCQIHHTHSDHWVATIFHKDKIYLLDSLVSERKDDIIIPDVLKVLLSQIYG